MKYSSTRNGASVTLDVALARGIAPDGGLYLPRTLPAFGIRDFEGTRDAAEVAGVLLRPFFEGSPLEPALNDILRETFYFDLPLRPVDVPDGRLHILELFHGATAAFKDVGAAFLAACLSRLQGGEDRPLTILVATSGDTGGAVAAAFDGRPGIRVVVLYPEGRVSDRQARQLTCWSENVLSLAVQGSFDDCQSLVKEALVDGDLAREFRFSSANSINIGRLLPQCIYYAHASLTRYRATGERASFVVPTGNLGNGLACLLTRRMGLPIGTIVLSTNANRLIPDFLAGAQWLPRESIPTLATAMDVGNPSNMERLRKLLGGAPQMAQELQAQAVSDEEISARIREEHSVSGLTVCPHTATALHAYRQLPAAARAGDWVVVATAHPAKFEQIVEPLIREEVPLPPALRDLLGKPQRYRRIGPTPGDFRAALREWPP